MWRVVLGWWILMAMWGCCNEADVSHYEATRRWLAPARIVKAEVFLVRADGYHPEKVDLVITDRELLERIRSALVQHSTYCGPDLRRIPPGWAYGHAGDGHDAVIYLDFKHPSPSLAGQNDSLILNIHGMRFSFHGEGYDGDSFTSPKLARLFLDRFSGLDGFDEVCASLRAHLEDQGRAFR